MGPGCALAFTDGRGRGFSVLLKPVMRDSNLRGNSLAGLARCGGMEGTRGLRSRTASAHPRKMTAMTSRLVAVALVVSSSALAYAEPQTAEDWNAIGVQHRKALRPGKALEAFKKAHDLAPTAKSRGQMGFVEHDMGHYVTAEQHLIEALTEETDPWVARNRKYLKEALDLSQRHLGSVSLVGGIAGATVAVSGNAVGVLPLDRPLRMTVGEAAITVSAPGHLTWRQEVRVSPGKTEELEVDLVPDRSDLPRGPVGVQAGSIQAQESLTADAKDGPGPSETPAGSSTNRVLKWSLVGAGIAVAAASAGYLAVTRRGCGDVECRRSPPSAVPGVVGVGSGLLLAGGVILYTW